MTQTFTITCRLPGANETEDKARTHWAIAAKARQEAEETVMWCAKAAGLKPVRSYPVEVVIMYYDSTKRDLDNCVNNKVIIDALTERMRGSRQGLGILKDDTRKYISRLETVVVPDAETRVVVTIKEKRMKEEYATITRERIRVDDRADREALALILVKAGYTVKIARVRTEGKIVNYVEYKEES